jgi:hypothetical protein
MKRFLVTAIAGAAATAAMAAPASAQTPSTLSGEQLVALFSKCNNNPGSPGVPNQPCASNPAPPTVEADCDPDGTSTMRYDIEATEPQTQGAFVVAPATGPYNGTFTESGTVTIAPQDDPPVPVSGSGPFDSVLTGSQGLNAGPLLTWTADFEIVSGDTIVRGRKVLTAESNGYGVCQDVTTAPPPFPPDTNVDGYFGIADAELAYAATIITPEGVYRDRGSATSDARESYVAYDNRRGPGNVTRDIYSDVGLLVEVFQSDLTAPEPAGKETCKMGGWRDFGLGFKNQGDCVSFFSTEGKNEPGQNVP